MTLHELFEGIPTRTGLPPDDAARTVTGLEYDSRRVAPGQVFFAFTGAKVDGQMFARDAVERGAVAVVSESPRPASFAAPWITVDHGRTALAAAARSFYRAPDERIALTGITGTNGKTTTSFLIDAMLRAAGRITGLVGTIEYHVANRVLPAVNTTPDSLDLYRLLHELEQAGGTHLTMEVSSHALALGRVHGVRFRTAVFTNLTRDHLDFHGSIDHYFESKQLLFAGLGAPAPEQAVVNGDDPYGRRIVEDSRARVRTYGLQPGNDLRAVEVESDFQGVRFAIEHEGGRTAVRSPLVGRINVYNLLAAFGTGLALDLEPEAAAAGLATCAAVPGRFQRVEEGQPFLVLVDYAHTDDALRNLTAAARDLNPRQVITVFGCGGNRDRTKRPLMAEAAALGSDYVILTSDNPRHEEPLDIIADALVGLRKHSTPHEMEPDREQAIRKAIARAQAGDVVLIAGKGHETYQVVKDQVLPFDDRTVAREALQREGYGGSAA